MNGFCTWLGAVALLALVIPCLAAAAGQDRPGSQRLPRAHLDGAYTGFFRGTNGWVAGDVGTSVPLSDGRVLWLFGDSYIDDFDPASGTVPCLFNARNAVLLQNPNEPMHPRSLMDAGPGDRSFFRPPGIKPGASWPCFWPGNGFQEGNTVYVYLAEMEQTPQGGMWGFKNIGQYWAKMAFPELTVTGYVKLPSFNGISFGCGFVNDTAGGFTYAYGERKHFTGSDVYVARFPTKAPQGGWTFWNGKGWDTGVTNAAAIGHGSSTSVNVCRIGDKFLLLATEFSVACDQGRTIFASLADRPTGPFPKLEAIYTVDDAVQGHHPFFYSAAPHPELINTNHELLITYCINGYEPCVPTCVKGRMNPDYYRPRAIRWPLP